MQRRQTGFTLIELSIVLVIIALIVGGVLIGRDLIHNAQRRSFVSELERINTAINAYRNKYNCLPGDCLNATHYFGKNTTLCNSASGTAGTPGTCNGDGNGVIVDNVESTYAWQQLILADLLSYSYPNSELEQPINRFMKAAYPQMTFDTDFELGKLGIIFSVGGVRLTDVIDFDKLYDDGNPNTGRFKIVDIMGSFYPADPNSCVTDDNPAQYPPYDNILISTDSACLFRYVFEQ